MTETLIVLRHARAGDRHEWTVQDDARPLDAVGLAQALALVEQLADVTIDRIWTSPSARCEQTVGPMAAIRRLPVVDQSWLAEDAAVPEIVDGVGRAPGGTLLCTHGDVASRITTHLAPDRELPELDKGAAWLVRLDAGRVIGIELREAPVTDGDATGWGVAERPGLRTAVR